MSKLNKLRTLIPLEELEHSAQAQIYDALDVPFLKILAIMPDCHMGYSLPIGGVALLDNVVSPAYVGYDIGCGMCNHPTDILESKVSERKKQKIFDEIYDKVPVGFNSREVAVEYTKFESASGDKELNKKVNDKLNVQLGTLGSGNHFIEIGVGKEGTLSVTIHSGSRNIGHSIASFYMNQEVAEYPKGFLPLDTDIGRAYVADMLFAQQYALDNRKTMMKEVLKILNAPFKNENMINENHNHAIVHENGDVLHRKGATPAKEGQMGVIPGNMRDGVYITRGLGNSEYLDSASHGAGRILSRKKTKSKIKMEDFTKTMKGIVAKVTKSTLDEAPFAYKNLDTVIGYQEGIVIDIVNHLRPIINIKG